MTFVSKRLATAIDLVMCDQPVTFGFWSMRIHRDKGLSVNAMTKDATVDLLRVDDNRLLTMRTDDNVVGAVNTIRVDGVYGISGGTTVRHMTVHSLTGHLCYAHSTL